MDQNSRLALNDGSSIPQIGFGTYKIAAVETAELVRTALGLGYRHIDTAALYGNEEGVGRGVRASNLPRDEVFITSKVWNDDHGFDRTLLAFDATMSRLDLDELDLYLIHWPIPSADLYVETWRALIRLREEGRVRSIGVSNFHAHHLERIISETGVVPTVNQVELHPWLPQKPLRAFHAEHGIVTEAWSPLARGRVLTDPALIERASMRNCSPAQLVIRWHLELGNVVIPKASSAERMLENRLAAEITFDRADADAIASLASGERTGRDPDTD